MNINARFVASNGKNGFVKMTGNMFFAATRRQHNFFRWGHSEQTGLLRNSQKSQSMNRTEVR